MIPVSKVVELFDANQIAPGTGRDLFVGGSGYPEQQAGAVDRIVYFPGGSSTLGELNQALQSAGPMGIAQAGGSRRRRGRKTKTKRRRSRRRRTSSSR